MTMVALNDILCYINNFPLSNTERRWLADKIVNPQATDKPVAAEAAATSTDEDFLNYLCGCWNDDEDADRMMDAMNSCRFTNHDKLSNLFDDK